MDRRELLRAGGITLVVGCCPEWIASAFAQEPAKSQKPSVFELSLARAKALGKPLLVFVVPTDLEMYRRRSLLATLLRCGSDELLASLALTEVVCARSDEVRKFDSDADPAAIAYVIEQEPKRRIASVNVALGPAPELQWMTDEALAKANRRWLAPLIERLRDTIVGDAEHFPRLVAVNLVQIDVTMRAMIEHDLREGHDVQTARVDRCAAQYYAEMLTSSVALEFCRPLLVKAASARLLDEAPAGATWVTDSASSCGNGPCGTGHVSESSRRFLYFLTERD